MKISSFSRIDKGDYSDAPEWFLRFADHLNPILDEIVRALQGRLTLDENHNCVYKEVELADSTELEISQEVKGNVVEVSVASSEYFGEFQFTWRKFTEERIGVRIKWVVAPATAQKVTLRILGD